MPDKRLPKFTSPDQFRDLTACGICVYRFPVSPGGTGRSNVAQGKVQEDKMSEREEQLDGMPSESLMDECRRLDAEIERLKAELAEEKRESHRARMTNAESVDLLKACRAELATSINSVCQLTGRLDEVLAELAEAQAALLAVYKWSIYGWMRGIPVSDATLAAVDRARVSAKVKE